MPFPELLKRIIATGGPTARGTIAQTTRLHDDKVSRPPDASLGRDAVDTARSLKPAAETQCMKGKDEVRGTMLPCNQICTVDALVFNITGRPACSRAVVGRLGQRWNSAVPPLMHAQAF